MASRLQRLDPERRRKRLALLAELADAKAVRDRIPSPDAMIRRGRVVAGRVSAERMRQLIATRRRLAG